MTAGALQILLEGGGSRTWAALATDTTVRATATATSTNPRSVGHEQATAILADLIAQLLPDRAEEVVGTGLAGVVAAHGAASTTATAARFADVLGDACVLAGASALPVQVTNDIAPLLLRGCGGPVCVAIAGTGTGFAARYGGACARASGLEWLLTDEGGGHDLACAGLRAVIRALDHRGPQTALTAAAADWCQTQSSQPLGEALFDTVYCGDYASKPHVATFAPHVLAAAAEGDTVAGALADTAADELATGVHAVCRSTGITARTPLTLVLSGSLLTGAAALRHRLAQRLHGIVEIAAMLEHTVEDHPEAMLTLGRAVRQDQTTITTLASAIPCWPPGLRHEQNPLWTDGAT